MRIDRVCTKTGFAKYRQPFEYFAKSRFQGPEIEVWRLGNRGQSSKLCEEMSLQNDQGAPNGENGGLNLSAEFKAGKVLWAFQTSGVMRVGVIGAGVL